MINTAILIKMNRYFALTWDKNQQVATFLNVNDKNFISDFTKHFPIYLARKTLFLIVIINIPNFIYLKQTENS